MHKGFTIAAIVNPPDVKLVNPTSVHWEGYIFFNAIYTEGTTAGFPEICYTLQYVIGLLELWAISM